LPAVAQDNFPDVPDNHWAFEALQRLKKDGLLVGYPDGLFRGGRPASRYELAVAIHAVYTNLKSVTDGLDSQIKALGDKLNGFATTSDIQNLRDALTALQNDVNGMKSYGDDIANLKKMADTFQKELQSLGVDVEAMKKDLGDLADRVKKLEHTKPAVNISGDVNLLMLASNSNSGRFGMDTDGRLEGSNAAIAGPVGLTQNMTMLQEGAFTFSGTNDTGPKWKGTLVAGNMLDTFGGQSQIHPGTGYVEGKSDVYLQDFSVKFDSSIAGLAFNAEVGRVGYKVSPYIFQRIDNTSYFKNERWDDGKYRLDGGILGFNFGSAKLDVFGGNTSHLTSVNGQELNTVQAGPLNGSGGGFTNLTIDRTLGLNFNMPLTTSGNLNLAYLWLDSDTGISAPVAANRLAVYGGDVNFTFGKIMLSGGYSQTDLQENESNVNNQDNSAWHADVKYDGGKWGLKGGYRQIQANYLAPGDWGQLGVMRNPTNIEGWTVGAHLDLSHAFTLWANGEFDQGYSSSFGPTTGFDTGTNINKYKVGLTYHANANLSFMVSYEDTEFQNLDAGFVGTFFPNNTNDDASYKWTTFGMGYGLSESAKLMIQYQVSDVSNDISPASLGGVGNGRFTGGILSTQLTIKF
jgi:hypothetical protein